MKEAFIPKWKVQALWALLGAVVLILILSAGFAQNWLLIPALLTSLCSALLYFFEVPLTIMGRLKHMTAVHACAVALSLALSAVMIPRLGMNGVNLVICLTAGGDALAMLLMAAWFSRAGKSGSGSEG